MASFFSPDKIGSMLAKPNEDPSKDEGVSWLMKYGSRGLAIFGGAISIIFGLFNCLGILLGNVSCLMGGIIQVMTGFLVLMIEAPCCCLFLDQIQVVSDIVDKRPIWNKAALFIGLPVVALMFCLDLTTIAGSGLVFVAGLLYAMMALGKKAPLEAMKSSASGAGGEFTGTSVQQPPLSNYTSFQSNQKSNLIENAQPVGFTGIPATHAY